MCVCLFQSRRPGVQCPDPVVEIGDARVVVVKVE
jgi:hypothetical protein